MNITKITIILADAADSVIFEYPITEGTWPYTQPATAIMRVAYDGGEAYVKAHFPDVPLEVVNTRIPRTPFSK
jgi:hypothetical protein